MGTLIYDVFAMILQTFTLFSSLKVHFDGYMISLWKHHIPAIFLDKESDAIRPELSCFDDNFRHVAQWVLAFSLF